MKTLTPTIIEAAKLVSKNSVRPALGNVYIDKAKIYATDSYLMLRIDRTKEKSTDISEFPDFPDTSKAELSSPILLNGAAITKSLKFNKKQKLPILEQAIFTNETENSIEITTCDDNMDKRSITLQKETDTFPETGPMDKLFYGPESDTRSVTLDPKLLIKLLKAFEGKDAIKLTVSSPEKPIMVEWEELSGLLMAKKEE